MSVSLSPGLFRGLSPGLFRGLSPDASAGPVEAVELRRRLQLDNTGG